MDGLFRQGATALVLSALLPAIGGCDPGQAGTPGRPGGRVAVVGAGARDPLWPVLQATAARFGRTTATYRIEAVTPDSASPAAQADIVQELCRQGVRGLCVHVLDPPAARNLLESLRAQGVVVVTMVRQVPSSEPFLHSGFDQRDLGAALADALAARIPQRGTVATLYAGQDPICGLRRAGFVAQISRYPRLTVLREFDCGGDPAAAIHLIREAMERFPGIDGWATMAPWPLQEPVTSRLLPAECSLVTPGPLPELPVYIASGRCQAVILPDYERVVTRALEMCLSAFQPAPLPLRNYYAPLRSVTHQNLPDFRKDWARWTEASGETHQPKTPTMQ